MIRDLLPGIFGLAGVVIGGVLNGSVNWRAERKRARLASVAGSRVIASELAQCNAVVKSCLVVRSLDLAAKDELFAVPSWAEYCEVLSYQGLQSFDSFEAVREAVQGVHTDAIFAKDESWNEGTERLLIRRSEDIEKALAVLAPLCRGDHLRPHRARWRAWHRSLGEGTKSEKAEARQASSQPK